MASKTKTAQVIEHMNQGRWKQALKIAKTFTIGVTQDQRAILARAYEAHHNGYLMAQMKRDPEICIQQGVDLLKSMYGRFLTGTDKAA
ncbi:MAG: hypothetical protein M9945_14460 [Aquamicrobium sp.]|uniref:hypothetical protein n=1 Tax=Aquamicrobium sp. TaxID=1872579 RepID=UPI00349EBFA4|nr:hypothetical protein [Aquamicrobium sp.]